MQKKKIAILGGGVGAMTAAMGLTSKPGWRDEYDITVYQLGWRLGGKGASGRNMQDGTHRIQEHGIHLWFGFYQNAFHVMREAYGELQAQNLAPGSPFQSWTDAFRPQKSGGLMLPVDGQWKQFQFEFPAGIGEPGEDWVFDPGKVPRTPWQFIQAWLDRMVDEFERHMPGPVAHPAAKLLHIAVRFAGSLHVDASNHTPQDHSWFAKLIEQFAEFFFGSEADVDLQMLRYIVDFGVTSILGILRDGVLEGGFYVLDDWDLIDWLGKHNARYPDSPFVLSIYDAVFAYAGGDPSPGARRLSAATSLYGNLLLTFAYRGSIAWRMCAGMGDTIFGPLYLVLRNRGVRFEFFSRVQGAKASGGLVEEIEIDVQATTKSGGEYDPLFPVEGLPCWPNAPLYGQLEQGDEIAAGGFNLESSWTEWCDKLPPKVLRRGVDFDEVVMGISLGAHRYVCPDLVDASPGWKQMSNAVATVQTQAMQLWLNKSGAEMGSAGKGGNAALLTSYVEPFDTYADFSHLIERETWPASAGVKQIAYFCNALPDADPLPPPFTDPGFPKREKQRVLANAKEFLEGAIHPVWPLATKDQVPQMDWDALVSLDPSARGEQRLLEQYFRANIDPSERYVLSLPGTSKYRLKSWESGFDNLWFAGDWTATGLDWGSVESAAMSGLMASQAMCGYPKVVFGAVPAPGVSE